MYKKSLLVLSIISPICMFAVQDCSSTPQKVTVCSLEEKICCGCDHTRTFGEHWSVCEKLYSYILDILPDGSTMLELGSGWASEELSKHYTVWSVEHDKEWLNKYDTNYIYAPIEKGWYSTEHLKKQLPEQYSLLLVDGPPGSIGRGKFLDNIDLFKTNIPIIFDDINRPAEYELMDKVAQLLKRDPELFECGKKRFGVLLPKDAEDSSE